MNLAVPRDHTEKIKDNEIRHNYLDLDREENKLSKLRVTMIQILFNNQKTVYRGFEKGWVKLETGGRIETMQTTTFFRSSGDLSEKWKRQKSCCHLDSKERPSANAGVKTSQRVI